MPTYFTYITPECKDLARTYNLLPDLLKLAEKIVKTQEVGNLPFFSSVFRKKALGKSYRLIIGELLDENSNASLLVFWRVYSKSSSGYGEFQRAPEDFEKDFEVDCEKYDLKSKLQEEITSASQDLLLPELSEAEKDFLWTPGGKTDGTDDWIVLESEDWVERTDPKKADEPGNLITRLSEIYE
jgi:hypothetical protein